VYLGIDGEGKGRAPHRYTLLATSDETGTFHRYIEREQGLTTDDCLEFLLELGNYHHTAFAFAFNYDLTKILSALSNEAIYYLFRPEKREQSFGGFSKVSYRDYKLHYNGAYFSVKQGKRKFQIWDLFKFYQSSFVKTLKNWSVTSQEEIDHIAKLKEQRSEFETTNIDTIRDYCLRECKLMGALAHKLVDSHADVGLKLTQFYGAGSTASLLLEIMEVDKKRRPPPPDMLDAVMRSFIGGRFENSHVGSLGKTRDRFNLIWFEPLFSYDVSSAYPYQTYRLPCLEHAKWQITTDEKLATSEDVTALILWQQNPNAPVSSWGALPFRSSKGTIIFPEAGGMGWTWKEEYLAAKDLFPENYKMVIAYYARKTCSCRPLPDLPKYYRERCRIGKNGPGIVLKLGPNAVYGKIAQSVGHPKFACWIWASLITSGVRAQILRAMKQASKLSNIISIATDGIISKERLILEKPDDTGTSDLEKPLGGWEEKILTDGLFLARPGISFPLTGISQAEVKSRGFGSKAIFNNAQIIMDTFARDGVNATVHLPGINRFYGAKTSVWKTSTGYTRTPEYGDWYMYEPYMSFNPMPKRVSMRPDGSLVCHRLSANVISSPYIRTEMSDDPLRILENIIDEQE